MKINIIAIGKQMPSWVKQAYQTYADRFPKDLPVLLKEINTSRRSNKEPTSTVIKADSERLYTAAPKGSFIIALDEHGQTFDTQQLAKQISQFQKQGQNISLLIGGADGLSSECLTKAEAIWSLSKLTLPHAFVRVILIEQLYRAWSLLVNHPYHRE